MTTNEIKELQDLLLKKKQLEEDIIWFEATMAENNFASQITWLGRIYDIPDIVGRSYMINELDAKRKELEDINWIVENVEVSNLSK